MGRAKDQKGNGNSGSVDVLDSLGNIQELFEKARAERDKLESEINERQQRVDQINAVLGDRRQHRRSGPRDGSKVSEAVNKMIAFMEPNVDYQLADLMKHAGLGGDIGYQYKQWAENNGFFKKIAHGRYALTDQGIARKTEIASAPAEPAEETAAS